MRWMLLIVIYVSLTSEKWVLVLKAVEKQVQGQKAKYHKE